MQIGWRPAAGPVIEDGFGFHEAVQVLGTAVKCTMTSPGKPLEELCFDDLRGEAHQRDRMSW